MKPSEVLRPLYQKYFGRGVDGAEPYGDGLYAQLDRLNDAAEIMMKYIAERHVKYQADARTWLSNAGQGEWPKWYRNASEWVVRLSSKHTGLIWGNHIDRPSESDDALPHTVEGCLDGSLYDQCTHQQAIDLIPAIADKYPLPKGEECKPSSVSTSHSQQSSSLGSSSPVSPAAPSSSPSKTTATPAAELKFPVWAVDSDSRIHYAVMLRSPTEGTFWSAGRTERAILYTIESVLASNGWRHCTHAEAAKVRPEILKTHPLPDEYPADVVKVWRSKHLNISFTLFVDGRMIGRNEETGEEHRAVTTDSQLDDGDFDIIYQRPAPQPESKPAQSEGEADAVDRADKAESDLSALREKCEKQEAVIVTMDSAIEFFKGSKVPQNIADAAWLAFGASKHFQSIDAAKFALSKLSGQSGGGA